jgi:pSer/pThr/pTyr-binding forkhead associated (FHA) protein
MGMPTASRSMPPPLPPSEPYMAAAGSPYGASRNRVATDLSLTYQNRTVDVNKDRFILGRSKSQADLVLDDANVSRQHAAIERVGDVWYLADLGSTNGCYVDGQRVSRRPIADGDVIEITTHQIRCTLR